MKATLLAIVGTTLCSVPLSFGELIAIDPLTGVTASSEIPPGFNRQDDFLVDGSGLSNGQHVNGPPDGTMWLSQGTAFGGDDLDPSVTFDLGGVYTINSIHVWNYNELAAMANDLTGRGVNAVTIQYGETEALGSTVPGITNFARADTTPTYAGEVFDGFPPFLARYIKFDIDTNHGGDNNFYGLSEVQFDGIPVDVDGDGLPDFFEEAHTNPPSATALNPGDDLENGGAGDGLTNLQEYENGTDPNNADTDGDSLEDGAEVAGAGLRPPTDPANSDTDGDGLDDAAETNTGAFVSASDTGTDPTVVDTDGDGLGDGEEVAKGSDPNDPNDLPPVQLLGLWTFDEEDDPQPDQSGFENHAAVNGAATWVLDAERDSGVMQFAGGPGLQVPHHESLTVTEGITLAAWVKPAAVSWDGIIAKNPFAGSGLNHAGNYELRLHTTGRHLEFLWEQGFANSTTAVNNAGNPIPNNVWTHVAFSGEPGGEYTFFVNGMAAASGVFPDNFLGQNTNPLYIGNRADTTTTAFDGCLDEVAVFDAPLAETQIQAIMSGDYSAFGITGGGDPLELRVSRDGADLRFDWKSQAGKRYNLRSATDPSTGAPENWPIYDGNSEIMATPDQNTLTIALPADPERFFVVEEFPAPPVAIFSENFDGADPGWTTGFYPADSGMNTAWELGDPTGEPLGAPTAANSAPNCYGTNLLDTYGISSDTWLRTPPIDLSGAVEATVTFQHWVDIDEFDNLDRGTVRVLDASVLPGTVTELGVIETNINGLSVGWEEFTGTLPESALGQSVSLEFRFESDADDFFSQVGWYIDDVVLTVPGS